MRKHAAGGGGAALGMEVLGLPGSIIGAHHEGGLRPAVGAGVGGGLGIGAGLGVKHLLNKYITGGAFEKQHPLLATAIEAAPLALGSTIGGALGSQLLKRASVFEEAGWARALHVLGLRV